MAATKEQIQTYMKQLYSRDKKSLIEEVQRNHRIIDVRGMSKDSAVSSLLESKFGRNYDKILFENQSPAYARGRERAMNALDSIPRNPANDKKVRTGKDWMIWETDGYGPGGKYKDFIIEFKAGGTRVVKQSLDDAIRYLKSQEYEV